MRPSARGGRAGLRRSARSAWRWAARPHSTPHRARAARLGAGVLVRARAQQHVQALHVPVPARQVQRREPVRVRAVDVRRDVRQRRQAVEVAFAGGRVERAVPFLRAPARMGYGFVNCGGLSARGQEAARRLLGRHTPSSRSPRSRSARGESRAPARSRCWRPRRRPWRRSGRHAFCARRKLCEYRRERKEHRDETQQRRPAGGGAWPLSRTMTSETTVAVRAENEACDYRWAACVGRAAGSSEELITQTMGQLFHYPKLRGSMRIVASRLSVGCLMSPK